MMPAAAPASSQSQQPQPQAWPPNPNAAVSIRGLFKHFDRKIAVNGLALDIPIGSFYGLVGPNGAGKTTTLNMVTGLLVPDAGRMDGFEMVRRIRQTDKQTPVLFLTARSAINDVVEGFELGANDYLKKPFGIQELIIRIKALVGKAYLFTENKVGNRFEVGSYLFDPVAQTLLHAGVKQELSHREAEILKRLCQNRNQVVNTQDVLLELWGDDSFFNSRSLHVFITKLRHKLSQARHDNVSYDMYLFHFPILQLCVYFGLPELGVVVSFVVALLATVVLSLLSWNLVGKRAMSFRSRLAAAR